MNVSILGAGVGGLCTAIALRKNGFDVSIYEKYTSVRDTGAGIVCWPNATFVLDELGMLEDIKQVAGKITRMCRIDRNNRSLGSLNIEKLNDRMGHNSYSILRRDLMSILTRHAKKLDIKFFFNCEAESIKTVSEGVAQVIFNNNIVIESDLIIGADGRMNSVGRKYVNADNRPEYQGFINWVGFFQSSHSLFPELSVKDYWGVGKRFGIVPISNNVAYWAGAMASKNIEEKNESDYIAELSNLFKDWPEPVEQVIQHSSLNQIRKIYVHDHNPIKVWHKNNVLIIGDAAHAPLPTSGQGACQAIEDAWHLMNFLKQDSNNLSSILNAFTKTRLEKTESIILGARQFAKSLFSTNVEECKQRDLKSIAMDYDLVVDGMAKGWASGLPI